MALEKVAGSDHGESSYPAFASSRASQSILLLRSMPGVCTGLGRVASCRRDKGYESDKLEGAGMGRPLEPEGYVL